MCKYPSMVAAAMYVLSGIVLGMLVPSVAEATEDAWFQKNQQEMKRLLALYEAASEADIVWGQEADDESRVRILEPPYFTPDPERVEVMLLVRYTDSTWRWSELLSRAWRQSLPSRVDVRRVPKGKWGNETHHLSDHWVVHQRVYFAGEMAGREDDVHQAIVEMTWPIDGLKSENQIVQVARRIGVDPGVFAQWREHPEVVWKARMASGITRDTSWTSTQLGTSNKPVAAYPEMMINGKYVVGATFMKSPTQAFRVANRLVRLELERGKSHDGPANDEQFASWMEPRTGEVFGRHWLGRSSSFRGVYNGARREVWRLGKTGEVERVYRLMGEGKDSYFSHGGDGEESDRGHFWRTGRQYVSFEGEHGPQRYGAFLLTDYLSARDTHWVSLPFKGWDAAMAFSSDGRVEARNDKGSMFGSWWLEAGELNVSFGDLGAQSWPWQEVAERVSYEVPPRSLTPWRDAGTGTAEANSASR